MAHLPVRIFFLILALVCFLLATFGAPKVSWRDAGYASITAAFLFG